MFNNIMEVSRRGELYPIREIGLNEFRSHRDKVLTKELNITRVMNEVWLRCTKCHKGAQINLRKIDPKYKVYHKCQINFYLIIIKENDLLYCYQSNQRFHF